MLKPAKKKKMTVSFLKKKVWTLFSLYIRTRDCFYTTGTLTKGKCITCNRLYPLQKLHAGHFVSGRGGAILFLEDNCHAQCAQCNIFEHGNITAYYPIMVSMFGKKRVDELISLKRAPSEFTLEKLEHIRQDIQKKMDYLINL